MVNTKDFKPMLELMLISEDWEIHIDGKGKFDIKINGSADSVKKGLDKVNNDADVKKIAEEFSKQIKQSILRDTLLGGVK